jgi:hypothetical protein
VTKNRSRWVSFYKLAHAYAEGTCDPSKIARFEAEFMVWLHQTSYEAAACWGALGSIGERANADHLKTLLLACPVRRTPSQFTREIVESATHEFEIDLGNAVLNDVVPDFTVLYRRPQ